MAGWLKDAVGCRPAELIPGQPGFDRALMLLAGVVAWWFRTSQVPLNTMLFALMLITLFDPASVLSVSLWLSFAATSALLIWAQNQPVTESIFAKGWMWLKGMFWVSVIASVATLPLIGFVFERMPVWSLVANMIAVPMYALWVLPLSMFGELLALLSLVSAATYLFELSAWGIGLVNEMLFTLQSYPAGNLWLRGDLAWVHLCLGLLFLVSGYLVFIQRGRYAIMLITVTLTGYSGLMLSESKVKAPSLYVWDVGQGASTLLRMPSFCILIDAPGKRDSKYNGGTIAADNARALGLLHLDAVILSHAQSDHAGGLSRLLASMNGVGELWLADVPSNRDYPAFKDAMGKVSIRWLKQGDEINLEDAKIDVLWPPLGYEPSNGNNSSLVLLVTLNSGQTLLFPGDMEKQVESKIITSLKPVDVMLIPHHGSKTSSTKAFVEKVQPRIAISQTGYRNYYGFPKVEVVSRYKEKGSLLLNTAQGAVEISLAEDSSYQTIQYAVDGVSKRKEIASYFDSTPMNK